MRPLTALHDLIWSEGCWLIALVGGVKLITVNKPPPVMHRTRGGRARGYSARCSGSDKHSVLQATACDDYTLSLCIFSEIGFTLWIAGAGFGMAEGALQSALDLAETLQ